MNVAKARAAAQSVGATVLAVDDEQYPPLLRAIHDPPSILYIRGDASLLLDAPVRGGGQPTCESRCRACRAGPQWPVESRWVACLFRHGAGH